MNASSTCCAPELVPVPCAVCAEAVMPVPVAGMEKCSLSDFPGYPSLVLFTAGCNYDCFFCHNRGLLGQPPCLDASYVRAFVERRAGLLDGAVVTGGEPTLHTGLPQLLRWLRQLGYRIKLDTNGSHPERLRAVLEEKLCDYVAVDWKAPSDQCKCTNERALLPCASAGILKKNQESAGVFDDQGRKTDTLGATNRRIQSKRPECGAMVQYS